MINFLETVLHWGLGIFAIYLLMISIYYCVQKAAKKSMEIQLQPRLDKLEQDEASLSKTKQQLSLAWEQISQKEIEISIAQQKATETLVNANKIKTEAEIKLQTMQQEILQTQQALNASRQRAKRLVKAKLSAL